MKRSTRRWLSAAALAVAVGVLVPASGAGGSAPDEGRGASRWTPRERRFADTVLPRKHRTKVIRRKIAPGLIYTKIIDYRVPRRMFILRADVANQTITFDVTLADDGLPARERVGQMAKEHGAIAAINGDWAVFGTGRPSHPFVEDGRFLQAPMPRGQSFVVSPDEDRIFIERPEQTVTAHETHTGETWRIDRWNRGEPEVGQIAAFSPLGGTAEMPPRDSCSIQLAPEGPVAFADPTGLKRRYTVAAAGCTHDRMPVGTGAVLSAIPGSAEATRLLSLPVGTDVTIAWDTGFRGIWDVMGGGGPIVTDGRETVRPDCTGGNCQAHPRTGIAIHETGRIMMVVVDGRQPRYSIGMASKAFAQLLVRLGAVKAIMLDGGGSSTMVVDGELVNRPSDGQQRHVSNAALILPGPDAGDP